MLPVAPCRVYQNAVRFFTLVKWGLFLKIRLPFHDNKLQPCAKQESWWTSKSCVILHYDHWLLCNIYKRTLYWNIFLKIIFHLKTSLKYKKIQYSMWSLDGCCVCANYISINSYQGFFLFQWLFICVDLFPKVYFYEDTNLEVLPTKKAIGHFQCYCPGIERCSSMNTCWPLWQRAPREIHLNISTINT